MRSLLCDIASAGGARASQGASGAGSVADPMRGLREAVLAHLRQLCGTPRGTALLSPDYGIEDATRIFHEYPGSITDVRRMLEETIRRYEPRLVNVSVEHVPSDDLELMLRFEIHGSLLSEGRLLPVRFTSVLDVDSHVELR